MLKFTSNTLQMDDSARTLSDTRQGVGGKHTHSSSNEVSGLPFLTSVFSSKNLA